MKSHTTRVTYMMSRNVIDIKTKYITSKLLNLFYLFEIKLQTNILINFKLLIKNKQCEFNRNSFAVRFKCIYSKSWFY